MNTSIEAFYCAMHSLGKIVSNKFDGLVRRITHDVSLLSLIYSHIRFFFIDCDWITIFEQ
jgi:hypothetical protein